MICVLTTQLGRQITLSVFLKPSVYPFFSIPLITPSRNSSSAELCVNNSLLIFHNGSFIEIESYCMYSSVSSFSYSGLFRRLIHFGMYMYIYNYDSLIIQYFSILELMYIKMGVFLAVSIHLFKYHLYWAVIYILYTLPIWGVQFSDFSIFTDMYSDYHYQF